MNSNPEQRPNTRTRAEKAGRWAEGFAVWLLRLQFFSVIARRVKTPGGELDIVARRADLVVFVEVKMRKTSAAKAEALQSVNQHRIVRAAQFFLSRHPGLANKTLRFDVIFLAPFAWPTHLKGAFELSH